MRSSPLRHWAKKRRKRFASCRGPGGRVLGRGMWPHSLVFFVVFFAPPWLFPLCLRVGTRSFPALYESLPQQGARSVPQEGWAQHGSVIQVMLWSRSHGMVSRNTSGDQGGQQSAMVVREACPACGSKRFKRNGHINTGKQNHQCKACGRQFVLDATKRVITVEQRTLVERLLREKISLHGIVPCGRRQYSMAHAFIITCFATFPADLHVRPVASPREVIIGRLEVEADEMWSFVAKKAQQAMGVARYGHTDTANHCVPRRGSQPRECATVVGECACSIPRAGDVLYGSICRLHRDHSDGQHKAITKHARKTNHIERFNNTVRQRISRLVRDTLTFSTKLANHIGAIKYFLCHYNRIRAAALLV